MLKKRIYIIVALLLCCSGFISAQGFKAGIYGGLSASQISGDALAGFNKAGFWGGPFVYYNFTDWSSLQMEISYIAKGSRKNSNPSKGDFYSYKLRLNYVEIPVLYQFNASDRFTLQGGLAFGYLLQAREFIYDSESFERIDDFKKRDVSANIGFIYHLSDRFDFLFRYSNSLIHVRTHQNGAGQFYNRGQRNSVLGMSMIYNFTER